MKRPFFQSEYTNGPPKLLLRPIMAHPPGPRMPRASSNLSIAFKIAHLATQRIYFPTDIFSTRGRVQFHVLVHYP